MTLQSIWTTSHSGRLDAKEVGEFSAEVTVEKTIEAPGKSIREYRARFNQKRRELIRDALISLIDKIDGELHEIHQVAKGLESNDNIPEAAWGTVAAYVDEIDALLGSSVQRPARWLDLRRHIHFGMVGDFNDIEKWVAVGKKGFATGNSMAHTNHSLWKLMTCLSWCQQSPLERLQLN